MASSTDHYYMKIPTIDVSLLLQKDHESRSLVIQQIHESCRSAGIFAVVNHGIPDNIIEEALNVNKKFFDSPSKIKEDFFTRDMYKAVKYGTNQDGDQDIFWEYLKLYSHPFDKFVDLWPKSPPDYREKMGNCTKEMRKLSIQICGAIMESLNLEATFLKSKIEKGIQMVAVNSYSHISESNMKIIDESQHSDFSIITLLQQSSSGLQIMDKNDEMWKSVPVIKGAFLVLVGDLLEVLSNEEYKAILHRVIRTSEDEVRMSVASFQSLEMDEILEPASNLVDEEHPQRYKGCSLRDYLKHGASEESMPFIETVKITPATIHE